MCIRIMASNGHQRALNQFNECFFAYLICGIALTCPLDDSHRGNIWCARIRQLSEDFCTILTCWMNKIVSTTAANKKMMFWQSTKCLLLSFNFFSLIPCPTPDDWFSFCSSNVLFRFVILAYIWIAQLLKLYCTMMAVEYHMKNSFPLALG